MQFAMILLFILVAACVLGSLITQGKTYEWYAAAYSERTAGAILALHLDDVFHSLWFVLLTAFLCLNLLLCNIVRLPSILRQWRESGTPETILSAGSSVQAKMKDAPDAAFARMGFRRVKEGSAEGRRCLYSVKNKAGLFGAWVCHLGVLLLILGFGLGQVLKTEYAVFGVPGQTKEIGDTGYQLTIDDFRIDERSDGSVSQYTADLTVQNADGSRKLSGSASVNSPASMFGMKFYQNSTGWAAAVHVKKDGKALQDEVVCAGDFLAAADKPELVIYLNAFYPDYVLENGTPTTKSREVRNPAYLYSVYYRGQMIGMNALLGDEELTIDEYTVTFSDPETYTLIQIKRDPLTPLALIGGLVTLLGLILALYVQPGRMWAVQEEDGTWTVRGYSRKGGAIFAERFREVTKGEPEHE